MDAEQKPTSSPRRSQDQEETLPLYEEFQCEQPEDSDDDRKPPPPSATANEVRDFLMHLLMFKRQLPEDYARRVARRWTIGTGQELRSYPPAMFLDIFGREDGWITYKEARLSIWRAEYTSPRPLFLAIVVIAAIWEALMGVTIKLTHFTENGAFASLAIIGGVMGGFVMLGASAGAMGHEDPEAAIENALAKCTSRRAESE